MGITINWRLGQEQQYIKKTLDDAQLYAEKIKDEATFFKVAVKIDRISETKLFINIGGCETIVFDFRSFKQWEDEANGNWEYENETLKDFKPFDNGEDEHIKKYPEQKMLWSSGFCKTQYAGNIIEHKYVADILKLVASRCHIAEILDEGDYYHSGVLEDANEAIDSLGKMINGLGDKLQTMGFDKIIKGGETKIKKIKRQ